MDASKITRTDSRIESTSWMPAMNLGQMQTIVRLAVARVARLSPSAPSVDRAGNHLGRHARRASPCLRFRGILTAGALTAAVSLAALCLEAAGAPDPPVAPVDAGYARWSRGPSSAPSFFPIAVWLQNPANAARYKAAGINLYVGLWRGPTIEQLGLLEKAGVGVICRQNQAGLEQKENKTIVGWMHNDEPDNAQSLGQGKGYGPPILPEVVQRDYEKTRAQDPTRPVFLNLGQGVAWDNYIGRGVRRNHPEDYREYLKGCDIGSFDIYPAVHDNSEVAGKLEFVARGVDRLTAWSPPGTIVWNCIECSRIGNRLVKPTGEQVRSEVWMALIHGSRGLIYFVHQFEPVFKEASLLDDPELLEAVTRINKRIEELAPALNSPSIENAATLQTDPPDGAVAMMVKSSGGSIHLFAVNMRDHPVQARFGFKAKPPGPRAVVLDESREIPLREGKFSDDFKPYEAHLYRIAN